MVIHSKLNFNTQYLIDLISCNNYISLQNPLILTIHFFTSSLAVTKLDILDDFDEIKIGVEYEIEGKTLTSPPGIYYLIFNYFALES